MMKQVHTFDGETHGWIDDPEEVRRAALPKPHLDLPPIPPGGVHNDFTAWLALERAKRAVATVGRHLAVCAAG